MIATGRADWDEVSRSVSDAYFPHRLHPSARSTARAAAADGFDLGNVRIATIGWGASVEVETEHAGGVAVNLPISGGLISRIGSRDLEATTTRATIYPADTPVRLTRWEADCVIVGVRFERDALAREVARILERPTALPSELDVIESGAAWLALIRALGGYRLGMPAVNERLAGAITTAFVLAACPEEPTPGARPRIVKRLLERLDADPAHPWTAGEMAEVAGVGVRRMQIGFREFVGRTPHEVLSDLRLDRIRRDLAAGVPGTTIAEVASRWGVGHLGRFALAYRRRFGETPSETLRAAICG